MGQSAECFYEKCGECLNKECACSCHNTNFYKNVMPPLIKPNGGRLLSIGTMYKDYNHSEFKDIMRGRRGRPSKTQKDLQNAKR